jgi:hypothetical protein
MLPRKERPKIRDLWMIYYVYNDDSSSQTAANGKARGRDHRVYPIIFLRLHDLATKIGNPQEGFPQVLKTSYTHGPIGRFPYR